MAPQEHYTKTEPVFTTFIVLSFAAVQRVNLETIQATTNRTPKTATIVGPVGRSSLYDNTKPRIVDTHAELVAIV